MSTLTAPLTGTITFLFTDIAGSTKLWEQHPDTMGPALARHDAILRRAVEQNNGFVFKTIGDAFCAAFPTAGLALNASLAAQLALTAETGDMPAPLLVRMALHTGACEERGSDYFGPPLNRVARLLATGHGGQVLLSDVTHGLVRDTPPASVTFQDLGTHRLRDLGRPETVFQLRHPDLLSEFPPLHSLDNPALPNNLPQQLTSFVGREQEAAEIKALSRKSRLVTLAGAGGAGKSRLSLQVAADQLEQFPEGAWLVELAPLSDPALVPQTVADTLGVREAAGRTVLQSLTEWLKPKRLLLILDNCEHLLGACAALVTALLKSCQGVQILVSSREPLGISGEWVYRVPSLSLPDLDQAQTVESLSQYEAVTLFIERAQAAQPSFAVTSANAPAVAQVCWRLDGIPLALELAAARMRSLSVEEVNARLDNRFRLLTGGSRTALPRQQTLRALIDWSYDLLTDREKTALCSLSVFAGGWTLAAAAAVCSAASTEEETTEKETTGEASTEDFLEDFAVLDLLTSLADKSLAAAETAAAAGSTRYRLLETVRQYGAERLAESGQAAQTRGRHAAWFLALGEQAELQLAGPEQGDWLTRLETEHDNLRATLTWYETLPEGVDAHLRLTGALWRFWQMHGHFSEGRQWLGKALERSTGAEAWSLEASLARAKALNGAGVLTYCQGEYGLARGFWEECLTLARQRGNQGGVAAALNNLGLAAINRGDYGAAKVLYEESLTLRRQMGEPNGIAITLSNLGHLAAKQGDYAPARVLLEESLALYRQMENPSGIAAALSSLGEAAFSEGEYEAARVLWEECVTLDRALGNLNGIAASLSSLGKAACAEAEYDLAKNLLDESLMLFRQIGNQGGVADALSSLGHVAVGQGEQGAARALYKESLTLRMQAGEPNGITYSLEEIAGAAQKQGKSQQAVQLLGAAAVSREANGAPLPFTEQEQIDKILSAARAVLGEDNYTEALEIGRGMTLDRAAEYARAEQ